MIDAFTAPLAFPFMQNAYLAALVLAPGAAMLSCFLVLKGWALMGDATAHATLPGVVAAALLGWPFAIGGFAAAFLAAQAVGLISTSSRVKPDTAMGVVFAGMFALGIVLHVALGAGFHLDQVLFGNMLGVDRAELATAAAIGLTVAVLLAAGWRNWLLWAFDPVQSRAAGLPGGWLHHGLLAMLAGMIVAMLSSVGLILAIGLLIAPGATAFLLTRRFGPMLALSVAICTLAMLGGVHLSFFIDSAPAPTIILLLTALFLAALTAKGQLRAAR